MGRKFKFATRLISVILTMLLVMQIVPMQIFANDIKAVSTEEKAGSEENKQESKGELLYEVIEKRDEYTKVYKRDDNTYTAVVSSTPLHYGDNGKWKEIDNTVQQKPGQNKKLSNINNAFNVDFPDKITQNDGISIKRDNYTISFSIDGIKDSNAKVKNDKKSKKESKNIADEALSKLSSNVVYKNIFKNTDVEYVLKSNSIKENIVINKKSAVKQNYSFTITAEGLTAEVSENGAVTFKAPDGKEIYEIPSPVMIDNANVSSNDIGVEVKNNNDGTYKMIYTPSAEWLGSEERDYPVKLDPAVIVGNDSSNSWLNNISVQKKGTEYSKSEINDKLMVVSNSVSDGVEIITQSYMKLNLEFFDILNQDITLTEAQLAFTGFNAGTIGLYEVENSFDFNTITYQNKPAMSPDVIDFFTTKPTQTTPTNTIHFDITKIFNQWLSGGKTNRGMALAIPSGTEGEAIIATSYNPSYEPMLCFDYVDTCGYDETYEYHTQSIGRAGTSFVNDFSRTLLLKRDDISISGNIMPVSVSFMYNSSLITKTNKLIEMNNYFNIDEAPIPNVYGDRWLTNYNRALFRNTLAVGTVIGEEYIGYVSENGDIIKFLPTEDENGNTVFKEENYKALGEKGYEILGIESIPSDCQTSGVEYLKVKTPKGETESFDVNGRLIKIEKPKKKDTDVQQSINIAYVSNLSTDNNYYAIDYITDGVGRKYDFTYNATTGLLQKIQCYTQDGSVIFAGNTLNYLQMQYFYTTENGKNLLTKVCFPDYSSISKGPYVAYEYNENQKLRSAKNVDGYTQVYEYDNSGKVKEVYEFVFESSSQTADAAGNHLTITPYGPNQTRFEDGQGNVELKQFDKFGRTSLVMDGKGGYAYTANSEDDFLSQSGWTSASENLLTNSNFEGGLSNWQIQNILESDINSQYKNSGEKSLKISSEVAATKKITQDISGISMGDYTLSAFLKSPDTDVSHTFTMKIKSLSTDGTVLAEEERKIASTGEDFTRYSVSLNAPSETKTIRIELGLENSLGEFYIDDIQLEKGKSASDYNYVVNGSFNNALDSWNIYDNTKSSLKQEKVNTRLTNSVVLSGNLYDINAINQDVKINGKKGDIVTIGAWIKADVIYNNVGSKLSQFGSETTNFCDNRFVSISAKYDYTEVLDGKTSLKSGVEEKRINEYVDDWQYVSKTFELKGDLESISLIVGKTGTDKDVKITELQMTKHSAPQVTQEPEEPVVPEVPTEPEETLCVCGENCDYGYGCDCACTDAAACTCDKCKGCQCEGCMKFRCTCTCETEEACTCKDCKKGYDITFDEFGNLLSLKITGMDKLNSLLSMFTAKTYTSTGNYMTSSTNENGQEIKYNYNEDSGMLSSTVDARGNITKYMYNAVGALAEVKTPVSNLADPFEANMTTNYSYKNDRVSAIKHNGFSYNIKYDWWGNVDSIYVGQFDTTFDRHLVQYTYGTNENRSRIEKMQYKNSDTITYRYEDNQITGISYDNGATYKYEYYYDEFGALVAIVDIMAERIIFYNGNSVEVYTGGNLSYKAYYNDEGNFTEIIDGTQYVTKNYDTTRIAETSETVSKFGVSSGNKNLGLINTKDFLGRTTEKLVMTRQPENYLESTSAFASVLTNYDYQATNGNATSHVSKITNTVKNFVSTTDQQTKSTYSFAYEYDNNNNITHEYSVDANGAKTLRYRYTYDEANQLVRVDDNVQSKTYKYLYNKGGNRIQTKTYPYTLGTDLGKETSSVLQSYLDLVWHDGMTSYDGKIISYDALGNPTAYNGTSYVWEGRQLKEVTNAEGKTQFEYDANGLRTQKRIYRPDGKLWLTVNYTWENGIIVSQSMVMIMYVTTNGVTKAVPSDPITSKIIYDENNQAIGYMVNSDAVYMFVKNLQGDVIALVDNQGDTVLEYSYDPWGKLEYKFTNPNMDETAAMFLTSLCPLTYRGYNYDFSTGLYYLQSRYYNPEWGRFLNTDDTNIMLAATGKNNASNLFAYCENNPVNKMDRNGKQSEGIAKQGEIIVATIMAIYGALTSPMGSTVLSMEKFSGSYDVYPSFNLFSVISYWSTQHWYGYERYTITTYGGTVSNWYRLIDAIEPYISLYGLWGIASTIFSKVSTALAALGGMAVVVSNASFIAAELGLSVMIVMMMIGGGIDKMKKEMRYMQPDDVYIFNWRVDYYYSFILSQPQNQTLYYYTPFALLFG